MLVILADGNSLEGDHYQIEEQFFKERNVEFRIEDCLTEESVIEKCKDADAVLSVYAPITERVINELTNCKVLVRYGIGFDNIDVKAASNKGIPVCNIPDYSIPEVATHTIAMLLHFERRIGLLDKSVREGKWNPNEGFNSKRLSSLTLGLVGFGNIAQETAKFAQAFGMNIVTYDPFIPDEVVHKFGIEKIELDELIEQSDYVSIHVPLNDGTFHLINQERLERMKNTAVILNTARGPIVDQDALVEAIKNGSIRGACLDVLEKEPVKVEDEILKLDNVVITPHAAFNSVEAKERLHTRVCETAYDILTGGRPQNIVNKAAVLS
ncbi:C-terminal binding protein [Oceanobacillus profundus]|uniref:C-terminal binding protein n=1 Tax=Oceanobacillus profundus TaxID=372463 RepID=A0A417YN57_9BACI|nr:C-terminal binding protein [Oceanobacillus profundus]RHW35251.1 C-terminal binding protein [Oceanobacillus profundus]